MAEEERRAFKPRPRHLYPVILSLAVTGILGYPISNQIVPQAQVTPFQGDSLGSAGLNAVIFVIALGASATAMLLMIRRGKMKFIRSLIRAAVLVVSFAVAFWYASSILFLIPNSPSDPLATVILLGVSLGTAIAIGLTFFGAAIGILAGTFLGFKALSKYEMFPGLPFSLLLGVAGMFLASFL